MQKTKIIYLVVIFFGFFGLAKSSMARTYSTNFPLTENPISENGNWINGGADGLDWHNCETGLADNGIAHIAYGLQPGNDSFTDGTCLLTGSWGPDQTVQATVYKGSVNATGYPEIEMRLRSSLSAHNCSGYETSFSLGQGSNGYLIIVRWNGPVGDFTYLNQYNGSQYNVVTGDVVKATITGNTINVYKNGTLMGTATDDTYPNGSPGMGFNFEVGGGSHNGYGFSGYSASDGSNTDTTPPAAPSGLSVY